jgi:Pvc16 N-terminal domain
MSAFAIQDVMTALQRRLRSALAADGLPANVYVGPPDDDTAKASDLTILLVRSIPSQALRNTERRLPPAGPNQPARVMPNATPLDLHLLLTVASTTSGGEPASLGTLGRVVQAIADAPILGPDEVPDQEARISLDFAATEDLARVWAMFPLTSYRPSLLYVVTPVWIDPAVILTDAAAVTGDTRRVGTLA